MCEGVRVRERGVWEQESVKRSEQGLYQNQKIRTWDFLRSLQNRFKIFREPIQNIFLSSQNIGNQYHSKFFLMIVTIRDIWVLSSRNTNFLGWLSLIPWQSGFPGLLHRIWDFSGVPGFSGTGRDPEIVSCWEKYVVKKSNRAGKSDKSLLIVPVKIAKIVTCREK